MASEYTLQLKATLDTAEVQQKLQQLLNNNALNNSTNQNVNLQNRNPLYNGINLNNLITTSINRLNQNIQRLTQLLQQSLNTSKLQQILQNTSSIGNGKTIITGNNAIYGNTISPRLIVKVKNDILELQRLLRSKDASIRNSAMKSSLYNDIINNADKYNNEFKGIRGYFKYHKYGGSYLDDLIPKLYKGLKNYIAYLNSNDIETNTLNNYKTKPFRRTAAGIGLSLATLQLSELQNVDPIKHSIGYTLGNASPGITNGIMAGSMMAAAGMSGGGAIVGVAMGAESILDAFLKMKNAKLESLAETINKISDAFDNLTEKTENFDKLKYNEGLKNKSYQYLTRLQTTSLTELEKARDKYYEEMAPLKDKLAQALEAYAREYFSTDNVAERKKIAGRHNVEIQKLQNQIDVVETDYIEALKKYNTTKLSASLAYSFEKNLNDKIKEGAKLDENYFKYFEDTTFQRNLNNGKYSLLDLQRIYNNILLKSNYNELKQEVTNFQKHGGFEAFNEETKQKALEFRLNNDDAGLEKYLREREVLAEKYKEQAEKVIKLDREYESLALAILSYKETLKNVNHGIAQSKRSYVLEDLTTKLNYKLQQLDDPLNHVSFREKFDRAATALRGFRKQYREQRKGSLDLFNKAEATDNIKEKQELILQANDMNSAASFTLSLVANLESFISNLNPLVAKPELGAVQSLGQYGFNMGENNDSFERQLEYLQRQLECQEEIRNILKEKSYNDEATFA